MNRAALCCTVVVALVAASPAGAAVRTHVFRFVDSSRSIALPNGTRVPRPLTTVVRYPATGGPHPLVVFGHGFALTPATYGRLLDAWAAAGFVVAAPIFPLESAEAPGGPDEADLLNEPRDMSIVITRLLTLDDQKHGLLAGRIEPREIAVAGHSDGAEAALAVAYDARYRDPRVRAAIVMSGAELPGMGPYPVHGPALLATQGTADRINAPVYTADYFARARRPKFLLWLVGASHLPPYTDAPRQLRVVEAATIAFLDHYLKGGSLRAFVQAAQQPGLTRLQSDP